MASVVFDKSEFRSMYQEFSQDVISDELLEMLFEQAVEIVGNTDDTSFSPYKPNGNPPKKERKLLLHLVTGHLATLASSHSGQVGRIASASEGSVSTSFDLPQAQSASGQWWNLTKYGQQYWVFTAKYRLGGRLYRFSGYHPYG